MTGWADVVLSEVFGGVSEVLGSPFPQTPSPHDAVSSVPITSTDQLTPLDRAKLTYMGIDPDSAGLDQINRALGRDQPLSVPPPAAPPPRPTTPAATPPNPDSPELRGAAAEAAKRLDEALARNHSAINDADDQLADAVLKASSSSAEGHQRLQRLQQEIIDEIDKLGSSLDTPAGQQQLAEFLQGKTGDILNVLKNAGLDSDSQARVLDGLSARYRGLHHDAGSDETPASDGQPQDAATSSGDAPPSTGDGGEDGLPAADPLLDGLASDPLLSGLGIMAGPAMGALGSLPGALGSAIPSLGGGGLGGAGLGDLGSALGSALHDGAAPSELDSDEHVEPLTETPQSNPEDDQSPDPTQPAGLADHGRDHPQLGDSDDAAAPAQPLEASTQVELPDQSVRTAGSSALATAGRAVLAGENIDDAYAAAQVQLPPPGAPISAPISPGRLQFGDVGQYTDHRVMALDKDHVWLNGQVTPIDQLETGPNFLGWTRPSTTTSTLTPVTTQPAPLTPATEPS